MEKMIFSHGDVVAHGGNKWIVTGSSLTVRHEGDDPAGDVYVVGGHYKLTDDDGEIAITVDATVDDIVLVTRADDVEKMDKVEESDDD